MNKPMIGPRRVIPIAGRKVSGVWESVKAIGERLPACD